MYKLFQITLNERMAKILNCFIFLREVSKKLELNKIQLIYKAYI